VVILAAIVLSVALTVAFSAEFAHRAEKKDEREALSSRTDLLAAEERQQPSYIAEDYKSGSARVIVDRRAAMKKYVPPNAPSNGSITVEHKRFIYSYRPIDARGLLVMEPAERPRAWGSFFRNLVLAGGVGAVLAAAISFWLAGSIVRPIRRVADASHSLAEGGSPEPLPTQGTAELAALSQAFNEMAAQLAASRDAERSFLLSVSHELKTPLTAIRGYAEGLAEEAFTPADASQTILVESRRLERLVGDLLDLARMDRHEFEVSTKPVDLAHVAGQAVARHDAAARQFGVVLSAEGGETWVEADHGRVLQVMSNLIENALRETPRGGSVTLRVEPCRLTVTDTGPGLDPADVPHAFDRFFLYDKHSRERPVGTGLGLAIVKQLAVAMGGDVSVHSTPGAGASFAVTFRPAVPPEPRPELQPGSEQEHRMPSAAPPRSTRA
jgi:two-component system sensor histidine kinase BaeS